MRVSPLRLKLSLQCSYVKIPRLLILNAIRNIMPQKCPFLFSFVRLFVCSLYFSVLLLQTTSLNLVRFGHLRQYLMMLIMMDLY